MGKKKAKSAEQKAQKLAKQSKKASKGEKKNKTKAATLNADSDADDDVDLDAVLAAYAEEQAKFLKVTEQLCAPPGPRSASTLTASPSNRNELFLFGGEYHDGTTASFYNDLFIYLIDREPRGKGKSPPARSGHRMTYFKNYIILFGGFQDTSQQTKYLNDTWIYDCKENTWHEMKLPPAAQKPDPRSSFSFLPHESGAVLYGGYSRVKAVATSGKQSKGGGPLVRNVLKPMVHQDTWFLRITPPATDAPSGTAPSLRWERRKRPANAPNPPRAGATMSFHKGRGVTFGGVHDVEESEEGIDSEFFNDMFIWNIDRNRFFPLILRRPKTGAKKQAQVSRRDRGKADEEELLRNLAALETNGTISTIEELKLNSHDDSNDESEPNKKDYPVRFEMPHPRFNAQLTVQDDVLYMFGGTFEKKDVEITFSDLYAVDLGKLDGVKELYHVEPANWNVATQDSDEEMDEDEDDEDSEMDTDEENDDAMSVDAPSTAPTEVTAPPAEPEMATETEPETSAAQDSRPFPRPFESLRDFYARTSEDWQRIVLESKNASGGHSVKELRKAAFEQAEERWWDCREEIRNLEDEQEAAGIGEIVNMADRATESGGARRR
ncbi:Kelch repeat-containing protein 3 [Exophiala xenobiotica]|nr:Kelch repeat-containing protein 3 [Exophiala xenobiotica]KAK5395360.1 Kelch repeat-containing protein 3 [Exophiala xenobiotica]KAK5407494.1 Kelch repeat-containing protein 3 [Exophiala xenobiotica]KAK5453900.1 Kelch repeat-containing protein 3 [Exophiala xenobiotica]KAK5483857.1 Kelch repeat-containing protein 3 [Exophiala xenobiotica]